MFGCLWFRCIEGWRVGLWSDAVAIEADACYVTPWHMLSPTDMFIYTPVKVYQSIYFRHIHIGTWMGYIMSPYVKRRFRLIVDGAQQSDDRFSFICYVDLCRHAFLRDPIASFELSEAGTLIHGHNEDNRDKKVSVAVQRAIVTCRDPSSVEVCRNSLNLEKWPCTNLMVKLTTCLWKEGNTCSSLFFLTIATFSSTVGSHWKVKIDIFLYLIHPFSPFPFERSSSEFFPPRIANFICSKLSEVQGLDLHLYIYMLYSLQVYTYTHHHNIHPCSACSAGYACYMLLDGARPQRSLTSLSLCGSPAP